ncbi:MAG: polysaccharide biosynthesis/export family protein, partial [Pseudomonadota bacterium]|nr:polysaccharide biosynthesis/export family protein [Pseudomonadota bacterium]
MPIVRHLPRCLALLITGILVAATGALAQTSGGIPNDTIVNNQGPLRLRTPIDASLQQQQQQQQSARGQGPYQNQLPGAYGQPYPQPMPLPPETPPGEFERYVQKLLDPTRAADRTLRPADENGSQQQGQQTLPNGALPVPRIRRFGSDLVTRIDDPNAAEDNPLVPPDYVIKPGDEIVVTLWGSVDADVRAQVDRGGRITIPRVGPVFVSGTRFADLSDVISRRVQQVFRNFQLSVSLGRLRGVRVFVTGYVVRPGAYSVSSLSTLTAALTKAGGPTAAGSFRDVNLRRNGKLLSTFDVYDFLLKGDRSADRLLAPDDVIQVGPVGPQVALIG